MKRRDLLAGIGNIGAGLILSGCSTVNRSFTVGTQSPQRGKKTMNVEVTAVEDLMREHGVLRRALFVYSEATTRLRSNPSEVPPDALARTAKLFRSFGEDYHEKKLEETFIFPAVKRGGGKAASMTDVLIKQHSRGREITDYILAVTKVGKFDLGSTEPLARTMESMVRMYRAHAAREDTVVFIAWKQILTTQQLDEMNEKFEDIEHEMFGKEGFENTVRQIADIETELGLADLAQLTAPPLK
jgi:hemerythrin-like domain-containing protein